MIYACVINQPYMPDFEKKILYIYNTPCDNLDLKKNLLFVKFIFDTFNQNVRTKQTVVIPMGTNCASLLAYLFLYSY